MTAGFAVADASVRVTPETGGFAAELTRALAGLEPVDVKVKVDAGTVRDEVRRAGEQGGRQGEQAGRDIGKKLSAGLKLGLAGAGAVVALSLKEAFSSATTGSAMLQAAFGQTAEQAEASSGIAAAVFRDNFGGSMSDAQTAVGQVTQAMGGFGKASDEQIRLATESALTLTDVFGIEMPETMRAASNLVKTGVAPDMTAAMDVITSGFQSGANKSDDFLDTLNEYAPQFAKLGLNGSQALALINQGLGAGARDSDVVADSLKEFSIRAIDGSVATSAAFAAAGLNAADMASRIAAGGPTAAAAFQQTLAAVNAITDPVQRNAALVGLFGTQAEDLGPKVFAAFDLSAKGVESVAGSTAKAGEAIYTTPQAKVSALVRTIKADLLDFLGDTVVPAVVGLGSKLAGPFETVKSAVQAVAPPFSALATLMGNHTATLGALATAVSVLVGAWVAYRTGVAVVSAVTKAWTAVQAAFNVVMALNPFVLIIVGLAALAAGLYYAYTHSETFRRIVTAALQGTWAVIKIVGGAFADFGRATAGVFVAIGNGVSSFVGFFVRIWRGGFDLAYSIVHGALTAVVGAIEIPLKFLQMLISLWFTYVTTIFKIGFAVFEGIVKFFIAIFTGDWAGAWNAIRDTTTKILGIVKDAVDKGLGAIKGFFTGAVEGIKTIWNGLREVAAAPVRFVVETVYNNGIRKAWNFVASKVGLPELGTLNVPGLAAGGPVAGGTPGRDSVLRMLMPGEHVLTTAEVDALGGHGAVFALRRALGGGGQAGGAAMGLGGWVSSAWDATGGKAVTALADAALGALADGLELVFKPLRSAMDATLGRGEDWPGGANRLMQSPMDALVAKVRGKETETIAASGGGGGGGGGDVERWRGVALQALASAGQSSPASWIDLLLKRMNQESGGDPTIVNKWDCLTIEHMILTRRGWLSHDQVRVGDETIGYNPETGRSEWTVIRHVVRYEDAEVWRIGNGSWHADVTPNHRWWSDTLTRVQPTFDTCDVCGWVPRGKKAPSRGVQVHRMKIHGLANPDGPRRNLRGEFVATSELRSKHRIRLAAPADTEGVPGLSLEEVRIIAWLQGDGSIKPVLAKPTVCPECDWRPAYAGPQPASQVGVHRRRAHGVTADRRHGVLAGYDGRIYQAKPAMVTKLRALLARVDHTESVRPRRKEHHLEGHTFILRRAFVTDLVKRSEIVETGPEAFVLRLSPDQRAAWLDAMIDAEGHRQPAERPEWRETVRIAQVNGPLQEAIKLAVYLEGWRPTFSASSAERNGYQPAGIVGMVSPHAAPSMFHEPLVLKRQPVWCVTTDLGTWTTRGGDALPFLTGNSNWKAGTPSVGLLPS